MSRGHRNPKGEAHVRLYRHEIECAAYRSLSPDARSLLIEFRALYTGQQNRVFMSVRQMADRMGVGVRPATRARDQLIDRGFIRVLSRGAFSRKARHASEFMLTNEPPTNTDGAVAPKDFMRWQQKNTVSETDTDSVRNDYRGGSKPALKPPHGIRNDYRESSFQPLHGVRNDYTDKLPMGVGAGALLLRVGGEIQFKLILGLLAAKVAA